VSVEGIDVKVTTAEPLQAASAANMRMPIGAQSERRNGDAKTTVELMAIDLAPGKSTVGLFYSHEQRGLGEDL
jgi:hypothetical protein